MTAFISPPPKLQFLDNNGNPLSGGKLYTYAAGTTTPQTTYTSSSGLTANTNPVILDSRGEASVWLGTASYKFKLTTSANSEIWTVDNIDSYSLSVADGSSFIGYLPAGTGAIATTVQSKLRETVSVFDFMTAAQIANVSSGTGTIDVSAAISAAFAYVRNNTAFVNTLIFPPGVYYVGTSINATNIRSGNDDGFFTIYAAGAKILGNCTGKPVFDFIRSNQFKLHGLMIYGDPINIPLCAIQFGRAINGETASNNAFVHVKATGNYSRCAVYNLASEQTYFQHCNFVIEGSSVDHYALILDGINYYAATSDYYTITIPQYTEQSFLNNTLINTSMRGGYSGDTGSALLMIETKNLTATNSYCVARGGRPAIVVGVYNNGRCTSSNLDIHCETNSGSDLSHYMYFKNLGGGTTGLTMDGLTIREPTLQAVTAFFGSDLSGRVTINDADIYVASIDTGAANLVFDSNRYNLIGRLNWSNGSYPGGIAIDFATAEIWASTFTGATLPLNGTYTLYEYSGANPTRRLINAGNTITQTTSKSTPVTINAVAGRITLDNAALASGSTVKFTVNNSYVTSNDVIVAHAKDGNASSAYNIWVDGVTDGSFEICVRNISGVSLSQAVQINFAIVSTNLY